ncbi:MAG TPA: lipid II flippase MurJ [Mycobacteriales bacterium]|nr:lipid II flippase MurJ [Mycobacteriales bacterium]
MTAPSPPRGALVRSGIARAAVLVAAVTVAARVVGFARIIVFAHTVGPSCLGDTYYTANTVPNILFDVVAGGALTGVVVPLLAGPVDARDGATADRTSSALLTWTLLLLLPVTAIGIVVSRPLMDLLVGGGHPGCPVGREEAVGARMLVVFMPQVLLYGAGIVLTGVLQAHRRFVAPALAPLCSSLVVIAAYLAFAVAADRRETSLSTLTRGHELLLSGGTTLGVVALVVPLLVPLGATGRRWRPTLRFPPGVAAAAARLAVAGAVVLGSQDLATAVVLRLANTHGSSGAVVLFNLAWTVFLLPWAVLAVPVATAAFPNLAGAWHRDDVASFAATSSRTARVVVLGCAAAAAVLAATAAPAARILVLGAPGHVAPGDLAWALAAFAPGLVGFGLVALLSRVHYARGDARTPAVATGLGWALTVAADVVLVLALPRSWAVTGLGLGTTIGMTAAAIGLASILHRRVPQSLLGAARTAGGAVGAAVVAGAAGAGLAALMPARGIGISVAEAAASTVLAMCIVAAVAFRTDRTTVELLLRRRSMEPADG